MTIIIIVAFNVVQHHNRNMVLRAMPQLFDADSSEILEGSSVGKLSNKAVLITGGTTGIGLATAKLFVGEGARLYITGRRQAALDVAVAQIGGNVTGVRSDVSNLADLDNLFAQIAEEAGTLDVLFANAGGGEFAAMGDISEDHFDKTFATNVKGTLFTVQKALPLLKDGSSVIMTGSTTGSTGTPNFSVYSATKAAVRNFARNWILDLKPRGIRVNVLSPGGTATPGLKGLVPEEMQGAMLDDIASQTPIGRIGRPEEIAQAALFLASDDSSFVTGTELFADGGQAQV